MLFLERRNIVGRLGLRSQIRMSSVSHMGMMSMDSQTPLQIISSSVLITLFLAESSFRVGHGEKVKEGIEGED